MAPESAAPEFILFDNVKKIGNTVAVAKRSANKKIANTLAALSAIYHAIKIAKGTKPRATYLDCSKLNLLSEISLDIDATIAFCNVSALEQTNAIPNTMKNDSMNGEKSPIRAKNAI